MLGLLLLVSHLLGDFYIAPYRRRQCKVTQQTHHAILHSVLYIIPFFLVFLFYQVQLYLIYCIFLVGLTHIFISFILIALGNYVIDEHKMDLVLLVIEQFLQIVSILGILITVNRFFGVNTPAVFFVRIVSVFEISQENFSTNILKPFALCLAVGIPFNTLFYEILEYLQGKKSFFTKDQTVLSEQVPYPELKQVIKPIVICSSNSSEDANHDLKRLIGFLERILYILAFLKNNYFFIGFVIISKNLLNAIILLKNRSSDQHYATDKMNAEVSLLESFFSLLYIFILSNLL